MASPFAEAWKLLKYFKNPHDEEASYGGVSYRDHPLFGMPGYEGTRRDMPREEATMDPREFADDVLMETPRNRQLDEPPFNPFEGTNPFAERQRMEASELDGIMPPRARESTKVGDMGRPQTIPMSPRGSKRGRGEQQAFDKPKKPEWWRTLAGDE